MDKILKLTESDLEEAAIEWFRELGYAYIHGSEIERPLKKVVLESRLRTFLSNTYPNIPDDKIEEALKQFVSNNGIDLDHRNRDFHMKMSKGFAVSWKDKDGTEKDCHVYPIDYDEIGNNEFLVVNQFTIDGKNTRRPDIIIFINGIPLVIVELKDMFNPDTTVENAFLQIQHYKEDIPLLFEYNAVTLISDGQETLHGTHSSSREWFTQWKSIDGRTTIEDGFELFSLIKGLFPKERLLRYLKYFIFHEDHNGTLIKKSAKYHQFFGVEFAVEQTKHAIKPFGDGRIGVVWHTQGAGKSISMAIYTAILKQMPELQNPTIVVEVDRRDLDSQLHGNFVDAQDLVGTVEQAESTEHLRQLLNTEGGGVIFTTIEKFRLIQNGDEKELRHPVLSERENIIVIADEAHRTQYGLVDGLARNIRDALPNASFIGFTGTPVDSKDSDTIGVFGNTIHVYDIKQAVSDKATVPIFYEPRLAQLHLANENIDEEAEEIIGNSDEANRLKWAAIEDAAGADDRVQKVAKDILSHFLNRTESLIGKAMIVCMSRKNCVKLYDAITKLENCPEIAVVMTSNLGKDPIGWNQHFRTKKEFEGIKSRFRNENDPLKIVIVRDMWLTGFDAPCVHTMYVDKIMQGHSLMQAIARVNRVFKDKPSGLVVDYIGIGDNLKNATDKYTQSGGEGKPTIDIDEAFEMFVTIVQEAKTFLPDFINYDKWRSLGSGDKILIAQTSVNYLVKSEDISNTFLESEKALSSLVPIVKSDDRIVEFSNDIGYIQHVGMALRKLIAPRDTRQKESAIEQLVTRSIESEEIIDVYAMAGIEKPDISILDDDFLAGAKEQKSGLDIKVKLLNNILNNELKLRLPTNKKKYISLKEEIEKVIERYHSNAIDSYTTIAELVERAKELRNEDKRRSELGLEPEELAFYDIISHSVTSIRDNELIRDIVKRVFKAVKSNLQLDWYKKENAKAQIRLAVKRELRDKVELAQLDKILAEIMEQAEGQYKDFPMVG
ncbi:MAG: type I restriction endonuclease subunit R [bacterium]